MKKHEFTKVIEQILENIYGEEASLIFKISDLIKYINIKTASANKGSKSRGSFANLYAIYVLVEDYCKKGFIENKKYSEYEGANYTELLKRTRELPFGSKLQNHALNHRLNSEFLKYYPEGKFQPIIRDEITSKYWFNENLLTLSINGNEINIANAILEIIDKYVECKQTSFNQFIIDLENLKKLENNVIKTTILDLLKPNVDARIFEIVSFSILKSKYNDIKIYWGYSIDKLKEENLTLFKTGRTNANDGGIDFIMKPLGRIFQVTETTDINKYFLDIEKVQKYPITFVIKSEENKEILMESIKKKAKEKYPVTKIIEKYMACIEELININDLREFLNLEIQKGNINQIIDEILLQSKVEFNQFTEEEIEE